MSKQVNPVAIGSFLVGSLILLFVGIMLFGGSEFFKDKKSFVIFFDSALNGLNVGAPVKLQGVQIGNVSEISLEIDPATGYIYKPVVIEVNPLILKDFHDGGFHMRHTPSELKHDAQKVIDAGLKARLETQSLLTGLLYVDLNFYPQKPGKLTNVNYKNLPELPSVTNTVDEIKSTADDWITKAKQWPVEQMVRDLAETLHETRTILKSDDVKNSIAALSISLQQTQKLLVEINKQAGPLLTNVNSVAAESKASLTTFNQEMGPILKLTQESLKQTTRVLETSQKTLNQVETLAEPDSPLGQALVGVKEASRSLKDLSETLERHPNAILYGK